MTDGNVQRALSTFISILMYEYVFFFYLIGLSGCVRMANDERVFSLSFSFAVAREKIQRIRTVWCVRACVYMLVRNPTVHRISCADTKSKR